MNDEFQKYLKLWKITDRAITDPTKENLEAAQEIVKWVTGQDDVKELIRAFDEVIDRPPEDSVKADTYKPVAVEPYNVVPFGTLLRKLRQSRNISLQRMSQLALISSSSLGRWERGNILPVTPEALAHIARALDLTHIEKITLTESYIAEISRRKNLS